MTKHQCMKYDKPCLGAGEHCGKDDCGGCNYYTGNKLYNYEHRVRTEDAAGRLLESLLKRGTLKHGWTIEDGTESHPWVVRGTRLK